MKSGAVRGCVASGDPPAPPRHPAIQPTAINATMATDAWTLILEIDGSGVSRGIAFA